MDRSSKPSLTILWSVDSMNLCEKKMRKQMFFKVSRSQNKIVTSHKKQRNEFIFYPDESEILET